jgi:hypothetical protein
MTPERKKQFLVAQANFINDKPCDFTGYEKLKQAFQQEMSNLGSGCSRCKQNAIKRKYIMKIQRIFESMS